MFKLIKAVALEPKEFDCVQYDKTIPKTGENFILKTYTKYKINN